MAADSSAEGPRRTQVIAIAPKYNLAGKHDATGAFQPEARRLVRLNPGGRLVLFDNRAAKPRRRAQVLSVLRHFLAQRDRDAQAVVAFFCHGMPRSIQAGFGPESREQLADALGPLVAGDAVLLYACNSGAPGPGNFAVGLSEALPGVRVVGHTTAGHTTRNPNLAFYEDGKRLWCPIPRRTLIKRLRTLDDPLRFRLHLEPLLEPPPQDGPQSP